MNLADKTVFSTYVAERQCTYIGTSDSFIIYTSWERTALCGKLARTRLVEIQISVIKNNTIDLSSKIEVRDKSNQKDIADTCCTVKAF